MDRVLITGGAGFIGSHTADALLRRGYAVRVLDRLDPQVHPDRKFPDYLPLEVERIEGDVRDPGHVEQALKDVTAVYHFASSTGVGQSMYDMRSYVDVNVTGTATLLEALLKSGQPLRRFVLSSSRAVYGEGSYRCPVHEIVYPPSRSRSQLSQGRFAPHCPLCGRDLEAVPTAEDRPMMPTSIYGWTKKHQEDLVFHAAESFGLPAVVLRYFNVYGSRQSLQNPYTGVVSIFYSRILANQALSLYERGEPIRDFVHIRDVVDANILALERDIPAGGGVNVGTGQRHTIQDIATALGNALGLSPQLLDTGEYRVGDIYACYADLLRAKQWLDYHPKITLDEGMKEFAGWARSQPSIDLYQKTVDELKQHGLFGQAGRDADAS